MAETLLEGETAKAVAKRYELMPSTGSDWRRMARQGELVLPDFDSMDFVPVEIESPAPVAQPLPTAFSGTLNVIKGDTTVLPLLVVTEPHPPVLDVIPEPIESVSHGQARLIDQPHHRLFFWRGQAIDKNQSKPLE